MPLPLAPIFLNGSIYCCNRQGLHVPLEVITIEDMRAARCYFEVE
jgi:hypothetical protein